MGRERRQASTSSSSSKLIKAAMKFLFLPCSSLCSTTPTTAYGGPTPPPSFNVGPGQDVDFCSPQRDALNFDGLESKEGDYVANISSKNLCTICLEPLLSSQTTSSQSPGKAVFTSQCSHSFHLSCISSNIRHGSVTCPICRAQWTRLPHTLHPPCWPARHQDDPIIRILDDSISTFRVHRRSFLRTAQYNDDDPVEPSEARSTSHPRLCFSLIPMDVPQTPSPSSSFCSCVHHPSPNGYPPGPESLNGSLSPWFKCKRAAYLCVRMAPQQAIDLVLVASPNGPHLRLLKQAISLVVFSLRPVDRLAIVSYSSSAARIFPLRRMTSNGKRAALQVIDRLFYAGHSDPSEGIRKGIKILKDRTFENPFSSILHLSDYPTSSQYFHAINDLEMSMPVSLHRFHVASTNSIMHELEEFLSQLLGGVIKEVQLRIGDQEDGRIVRLGDLRGDEERRVLLEVDESHDHACVGYSYIEGGLRVDEHIRVGEVVVGIGDPRDTDDGRESSVSGGRTSCVDSWDYHDPYMGRRWAKRLHGRHRI